MDAGEDLHGHQRGVFAGELAVDLDDAAELQLQVVSAEVGEVEVDHVSAPDAEALIDADVEDFSGGDVAGDDVAILGVFLFEEIESFVLGDIAGISAVGLGAGHPNSPPFAAGGLRHQPQLVRAGDRCGVDLDELTVGIPRPRLIAPAGRGARAHHRVRTLAEDHAAAAGRDDHRLRSEGANLHGADVLGDDPDAPAPRIVRLQHRPEELPVLVLVDLALRFGSANLLIQRVEQLLAGSRSGKMGALIE